MEEKNISKEILTHFRCIFCDKWWTVADKDEGKNDWYCPWCGKIQE